MSKHIFFGIKDPFYCLRKGANKLTYAQRFALEKKHAETMSSKTPFFADPFFIRRDANVKRAKLVINITLRISAIAALVLIIFSVLKITISDTFSILWLLHPAHIPLAIWAFFVARPATYDSTVTVSFIVAYGLQFLADFAGLIARYILIAACNSDSTPSTDCEDHDIIASYVLLPLNWVLVGASIVFVVCGVIIAIYQPSVIQRVTRALEIARNAAGTQPVTVNVNNATGEVVSSSGMGINNGIVLGKERRKAKYRQ